MKRSGRIWIAVIFALAFTAVGIGLVARLPDQAECRSSGRTVDPTVRHCVGPGGKVQLREHVVSHVAEVTMFASLGFVLVLAFQWYQHRRRQGA